jgi:group I intron endonuclease
MGLVYRLDFSNGKTYIGITRQSARRRFIQHASLARNGQNTALYNAWRKHGAPRMSVIAECANDDLHALEIRLIAEHATLAPAGYNSTTGGEISPMLFPDVVERIAAKKRGQRHTKETRDKMSVSRSSLASPNKGKTFSLEWRQNMADAQRGRTHPPEVKAKMSAARKAYWAAKKADVGGSGTAL